LPPTWNNISYPHKILLLSISRFHPPLFTERSQAFLRIHTPLSVSDSNWRSLTRYPCPRLELCQCENLDTINFVILKYNFIHLFSYVHALSCANVKISTQSTLSFLNITLFICSHIPPTTAIHIHPHILFIFGVAHPNLNNSKLTLASQ